MTRGTNLQKIENIRKIRERKIYSKSFEKRDPKQN